MNSSDPRQTFCPANEIVWSNSYLVEKQLLLLASIILSSICCPLTIAMNVLLIVAIKTTRCLHTNYNILLACVAGADLLVGIAVQPCFLAGQIVNFKGISLADYCTIFRKASVIFIIPLFASLYLLTVLSGERFVALKHSLRYATTITKPRLLMAVVCAWIIAVSPAIFRSLDKNLNSVMRALFVFFSVLNILLVLYFHASVFFVIHRYEKQIHSQRVSPQVTVNFIREKQAVKTTRVAITSFICCYLPTFVLSSSVDLLSSANTYVGNVIILSHPLLLSLYMVSSLCNPMISCYSNRLLRQVVRKLLRPEI